jgi:DNA-binding MarR family transcriptional regulator
MSGPAPGFYIWRLSTKWRVAVDRALAPLDLTHAQYALLASLYAMHHDGAEPSQRALADRTGMEPLYVSKLARSLEAAGLVERAADPRDTRAVRLRLTDAGLTTTANAIAVVVELSDRLMAPLGGLGSERTDAFVRAVQTLLDVSLDTHRTEEE